MTYRAFVRREVKVTQRSVCRICSMVPATELTELDALLADPSQWAKNALEGWVIPPGALPGNIRQYGGIATGLQWMREHGFPDAAIKNGMKGNLRQSMEIHFKRHVVHIAKDKAEIEQLGQMVSGPADHSLAVLPESRANLFLDYYSTGIRLGVYALNKLEAQVREMEQQGKPVSERMLWQLAELGGKLAQSQAQLLVRGGMKDDSADAMGGFRRGEAPLPSARFGDHRVRTINGEARPVVDAGPADRKEHNERARAAGEAPTFDA
jgi:hypothetical protein